VAGELSGKTRVVQDGVAVLANMRDELSVPDMDQAW